MQLNSAWGGGQEDVEQDDNAKCPGKERLPHHAARAAAAHFVLKPITNGRDSKNCRTWVSKVKKQGTKIVQLSVGWKTPMI